ncbi:MAG: outer membrane beta-barrel protein [Bacteroidia bacterium]|nr:outer membrane beta-barrel protein [Bacteroidia bacterium]
MRIYICIVCFVFFITQLVSQNEYKIKGRITDSLSQPVEAAIISLVNSHDNHLTKTAFSEASGFFEFHLIKPDTFNLIVTAEGFSKCMVQKVVAGNNENIIVLNAGSQNLKEVTVVAKQNFIERKIDRTIINPDGQISLAGTNAFDLLSRSPGIMVNQNGEIKMKGKVGVIIYVDDKPTYLSGTELENFLRSIPVSSIKQIELITNPPAKYEAAGNAGIINFKTKKTRLEGINGNISLNYAQGRYARTNNNLNLNYSNKKIAIYSNFGGSVINHYQNLTINRLYKNEDLSTKSIFTQNTYIKIGTQAYNLRGAIDYYISNKTTLGFSAKAMYSPTQISKYNFAEFLNADNTLNNTVIADNRDKNELKNATFNLNIRHLIDSVGKELTFNADHIRYHVNFRQTFKNDILIPDGTNIYADLQAGNLLSDINIYAFKTDYTNPLKNNSSFDMGLKTAYTETNNDARYDFTQNQITTPNYSLTNTFLYDELINAAYINYTKNFSRLDIQAGLRFEATNLFAKQLGNPIRESLAFDRNYQNLFPTVYVSYKLDSSGNNILSLDYGKRIDRPFYKDLNPFVSPLDKYTYYAGNPYLLPSIAHNINLLYSYKSLFAVTLSYNNVTNQTRETIEINNGIYYSRPGNIGSTVQYNATFQGALPVAKWLTTNYISEVSYAEYKSKLYTEQLNSSGMYFYINLNNAVALKKGWAFELSGEYLTDVTETQFIIGDFGHTSVGIQKRILKDKGVLKFSLSDILFTNRIRGTINNLQLTNAGWYSLRDTRVASVTFVYRFGNNTNKKPKYNSNSVESETKRIK